MSERTLVSRPRVFDSDEEAYKSPLVCANGVEDGSDTGNDTRSEDSDDDDGVMTSARDADSTPEESSGDEGHADVGVVQFTSSEYVVSSDSRVAKVGLMRIGREDSLASVWYQTKGDTAIPKRHYEEKSGRVTFQPGQNLAVIEILIIEDGTWDTAREFTVKLSGQRNCVLGKYLHHTRVCRVDPDTFPDSRFSSSILQNNGEVNEKAMREINNRALLFAFLRLVWTVPGVPLRVFITVVVDMLENLNVILQLELSVILIDVVLEKGGHSVLIPEGWSKHQASLAVACMMIAPLFFIHLARYVQTKFSLAGWLLKWFRKSIFRKYLNLTEVARFSVPPSDVLIRIDRDAETLCNAVATCLSGVGVVCRILISLAFAIQDDPGSWWICVILVIAIGALAALRTDKRGRLETDLGNAETDMAAFVRMSLDNIQLITDCRKRYVMNDMFSKKVNSFAEASLPLNVFTMNNDRILEWFGTGVKAAFIICNTRPVLDGTLPLGRFNAMLRIIETVQGSMRSFCDILIDVASSYAPLKDITLLLNSPMALKVDQFDPQLSYDHTGCTIRGLSLSMAGAHPGLSPFDALPIELKKVSFRYGTEVRSVLAGASMTAKQGEIVQISGGDATCKRTIVRLLARGILPNGGKLCIPTHLRTMCVNNRGRMLQMSLWDNLTFACAHQPKAKRVLAIVDMLDMPVTKSILAREILWKKGRFDIHKDEDTSEDFQFVRIGKKMLSWAKKYAHESKDKWHDQKDLSILPETEVAKVSLARAFIMNPEVLILSRPLDAYSEEKTKKLIWKLVHEHRNQRGLAMGDDVQKRMRRRPRTVFVTTTEMERGLSGAAVWKIRSTDADGVGPPFMLEGGRQGVHKVWSP